MATVLVIASAIITALNVYLTVRNIRAWRRMNEKPLPVIQQAVASGLMSPNQAISSLAQPLLYPSSGWHLSGTTSGPVAQAPRITSYIPSNIQVHQFSTATEPVTNLTVPDEEEDVILTGWKRFDVSNGFLVSPVSGYVWHSPRLTASCPQLYNLGIGPEACTAAVPKHLQDPMAAHNCGIFATKDPESLLGSYETAGAIAKVSLFGIVQEGQYGYAAEKCIIEEVYLIRDTNDDDLEALTYRYNVPVKEETPWT